jgi:rRNA maturation RNase YbeY
MMDTPEETIFHSPRKGIRFVSKYKGFSLEHKKTLRKWIHQVIQAEGKAYHTILITFYDDPGLLEINRKFLNHDDLTDIITFPYSANPIQAEIFISVDRVKENAAKFETTFENELHRVMVHGVLHMCGYSDKTNAQRQQMREKEDSSLDLLKI